jgi:hypothetical protein
MKTETAVTQQEMLDHYHQRFTNYHSVQFTKDRLATAAEAASKSAEACAKIVTAHQNARFAGSCIDKAKQEDALDARLARARAKLAKKQGK